MASLSDFIDNRKISGRGANPIFLTTSKFRKTHWKTPVQKPLFNKVSGSTCNYIKKEALTQVFYCEFCNIFKNSFFLTNNSGGCLCKQKGSNSNFLNIAGN